MVVWTSLVGRTRSHLACESLPCAESAALEQRISVGGPYYSLIISFTSTDPTTRPREVQLLFQASQSNRLYFEVCLQQLPKQPSMSGPLTSRELDNAERYWLNFVHKTAFPAKVTSRQRHGSLPLPLGSTVLTT